MNQLDQLKSKWLSENIKLPLPASDEEILLFQSNNKIFLPEDIITYFKIINGTGDEYDGSLYQFYSISQVKKLQEEYKDWEGIPDYKNIFNTLDESENYYVFANYSFHLFSYVIKLYSDSSADNEILVLCGGEFNKIANSFSEFLELYKGDSIELQFNK